MSLVSRYTHWLHTRWPAGSVEKLPVVGEDGLTNVPGVRVVGDLSGIPLLKFSADTGARAVQAILKEPNFKATGGDGEPYDLVIIGAGVSGIAAALEARKAGLSFVLYEAAEPFNTLVNFPKGKPIFTYPTEMVPAGDMRFSAQVKEALIEELETQRTAAGIEPVQQRISHVSRKGGGLVVVLGDKAKTEVKTQRVIIGIGRSGNYRKLGVPGQELDKVYHRLYDPREYADKDVLVVGGGDSALESAIALATLGARVTLSYRKPEFARPKPENIEKLQELAQNPEAPVEIENPVSERVNSAAGAGLSEGAHRGTLKLMMASQIQSITDAEVQIRDADGVDQTLRNDVVFAMIGREPPLDFFRRSGVHINGEWRPATWVGLIAFFLFCVWIYHWKSYSWFAFDWLNPAGWIAAARGAFAESAADKTSFLYTLFESASGPSFYYTLLYSSAIAFFGYKRVKRRNTPYIKAQTTSLVLFQWIPLFLLPEIILPLMGHNGLFDGGLLGSMADSLFPEVTYGHGREYWRAYGLILAWPLMVYNIFTDQPIWGWVILGSLQTFVILPLLIRRWGKGVYCGWMCSCGGLAETLGDTHRHKMPHGPKYNRLNMIGQVVLALAFIMLFIRIWGWVSPESWAAKQFAVLLQDKSPLTYKWSVDVALAGFMGVGFYFHFSGRVWCRFACPLAALMHIYARFSKFRIFPEKKKCISCNVCTSVCHQGIDIMNFANKGIPMQDPECVRCSACVQSCPTGVLAFGYLDKDGKIRLDKLAASPVRMKEEAA